VSLDDLQQAIDTSLAAASPLTQSLFSRRRLPAAAVQRFINTVMGATVATVTADGRPHAATVLVACHEGEIIFTVSPRSLLLGNLRRNTAVALTVTNPDHTVIVMGQARLLGKPANLPELTVDLHRLSKRGRFTPQGWSGYLYAVTIEKIFVN
jgi:pyridoxine/pyridoxamine 5'-phosphate oxidase